MMRSLLSLLLGMALCIAIPAAALLIAYTLKTIL